MTTADLHEYLKLAQSDLDLDRSRKPRFVALGRQMAVRLACDLALKPGSFQLDVNESRDGVVLRAEHLCVVLESFGSGFMFRAHGGWGDEKGGCNNWLPFSALRSDYPGVLCMLRSCMDTGAALLTTA